MPDDIESGDGVDDAAMIDPRYDPAFQRGYSGEVVSSPRGSAALRRAAAASTSAMSTTPSRPTPERIEDFRPITPATPAPVSLAAGMDAGDLAASDMGASDLDAASRLPTVSAAAAPLAPRAPGPSPAVTPQELARNPFVIAIAAIALFLIVAGAVWAAQGFASIIQNGGTRNEVKFWAAQTMTFGAPLAIVVGFAVVAVLLALFARAWQRSRD
jgi:hypothetical protein